MTADKLPPMLECNLPSYHPSIAQLRRYLSDLTPEQRAAVGIRTPEDCKTHLAREYYLHVAATQLWNALAKKQAQLETECAWFNIAGVTYRRMRTELGASRVAHRAAVAECWETHTALDAVISELSDATEALLDPVILAKCDWLTDLISSGRAALSTPTNSTGERKGSNVKTSKAADSAEGKVRPMRSQIVDYGAILTEIDARERADREAKAADSAEENRLSEYGAFDGYKYAHEGSAERCYKGPPCVVTLEPVENGLRYKHSVDHGIGKADSAGGECRKPLPPDVLADALQDRIHPTSGRLISASPVGDEQIRKMVDGEIKWVDPPAKAPNSGGDADARKLESENDLMLRAYQKELHRAEKAEAEVQRWEAAGEALEEAAKAKVDAALKRVTELEEKLFRAMSPTSLAKMIDELPQATIWEEKAQLLKELDKRTVESAKDRRDAKVEALREAYDRCCKVTFSTNSLNVISDMINELT